MASAEKIIDHSNVGEPAETLGGRLSKLKDVRGEGGFLSSVGRKAGSSSSSSAERDMMRAELRHV